LDLAIPFYILTFIILFLLSAFFSSSETAFFSYSRADIERTKKKTEPAAKQVVNLLAFPQKLLITIVIGNTVVNIAAASLAALLTLQISEYYKWDDTIAIIINVVVVTFIILIFTEIIPKVAAVKSPYKLAQKFVYPLTVFYYIFSPITSILNTLTHWLTHTLKLAKNKSLLSEEELKTLVDFGEEKGTLEEEEKEMIHSIFEFGETSVKEIMIPRIDMISISSTAEIEELLDLIKEHLHSRMPVYKETVDNIVGVVYAKDLLPLMNTKKSKDVSIDKLTRPAYFVPEQKKIDDLLREFQSEKIHMAIVVDEYGGTSGLVTLEDIIEEIVGEIQDEYDSDLPLHKQISENVFMVDGSMPLEEINEELNFNLPTEEGVETIGGFLFGLFGSVPKEKEIAKYNGYEFIIEKIVERRIKQVRIIKKEKTK
jgi:magnesium and cobalt exporter, CNNM family